MSQDDQGADRSGLSALSANASSEDIKQYYDDWAGDYDRDLADWNYQAPMMAAELLWPTASAEATILDVGCGTGLTGQALQSVGFENITGVDISPRSLERAGQTGAYRRLQQVDLHDLPLSFGPSAFEGLQCIGVLSYVPDTEPILREFCRLVSSGGAVVFSQRQDLYVERNYETVLDEMERDGAWAIASVSDPQPYLPENEEFGDMLNVIFVTALVR